MPTPFDHCGYCGAPFAPEARWPRTCVQCGQLSFRNPLPVAVMLVPVDGGLLAVRRGIEPGLGKVALPGGFINWGESWQAAGAREVYEETGVTIASESIREFAVRSSLDGAHLVIFGLAAPLTAAMLPPFVHDHETLEVLLITAPQQQAFDLHTKIVAEYFRAR
jgi:ADP-ribose pyrophosphatase YjhB (NUDIX family)